MTLNNEKNNQKRIQKISLPIALVFVLIMGSIGPSIQNAFATNCITAYGQHCYAVHEFYPSPVANGVGSTYKVYNKYIASGWVNSAAWAYLVNGRLAETGWDDPSGTQPVTFYAAVDGMIKSAWGTPTNGTSYTFYTHDDNKDNTWVMTVNGGYYTSNLGGYTANILETGYEKTYTDSSINKNDYSNMLLVRDGTWYNWSSSQGSHGTNVVPTSLYYVLYCSDAPYSHSQHGNAPAPGSCS
ncbi:MAG: hypothetical protein ACYDAJ_08050 [Nitrosotalea sp.]